MDTTCGLKAATQHTFKSRAEHQIPPDLLVGLVGPTASGKTQLAVAIAEALDGEIISVDSRQVYRGMNIGTGKDLNEYGDIAHHLIDICAPGDRYHVADFQVDFQRAYTSIVGRQKRAIACGGTGMYLQSVLQERPYTQIPVDLAFRETLMDLPKEDLQHRIQQYVQPEDLHIDLSTHKRMVRGLEILSWLAQNPEAKSTSATVYPYCVFGLNPALQDRRLRISQRLRERLNYGLMEEVEELLQQGISHDQLQYYGLEYKYASLYLLGAYTQSAFVEKLETEIHRYAKRQMTYFRKMEKDGIHIHWLAGENTAERLEEVLELLNIKKG